MIPRLRPFLWIVFHYLDITKANVLRPRLREVLLLDPVSILLSEPSGMVNFLYAEVDVTILFVLLLLHNPARSSFCNRPGANGVPRLGLAAARYFPLTQG